MNKNIIILLSLVVIEAIFLFLQDPISQDQKYHIFADNRTILGIRNFFDVLSNLSFLIVGVIGLSYSLSNRRSKNISLAWIILFIGVLLIAPGSAYYHLSPNNLTLIWDRLPMTIGFTALLSELLSIFINRKLEKILLPALLILGIGSVLYWARFDDLRPYIFVQLTPILLIPACIFMFKTDHINTSYLWGAFFFYFLAKVFEYFDEVIFNYLGSQVSGHSLKHVSAAVAIYCFYLLIKNQKKA